MSQQQVSSHLAAATSTPPSCAPVSDHARGRARPSIAQTSSSAAVDVHSVFDVLNLFRARWFLNRDHLLSLVVFAQKVDTGNEISWVEFTPQAHSHLVRQALALAPPSYPLALCKRVLFTFILEVINDQGTRSLASFVKTSAPRHRQVRVSVPTPSPPPPSEVLTERPSALTIIPLSSPLQAAPVMAVDSPSPPPSPLSTLSHTPTPRALEFQVATPVVSLPPASRVSSPSPSVSPEASGSLHDAFGLIPPTPGSKRSGRKLHERERRAEAKRGRDPTSPPLTPQDVSYLLVPSNRAGQRYTLDSLVAYKAALRDLRVRARISVEEEESNFAAHASLSAAPPIPSPSPPPPPPRQRRPTARSRAHALTRASVDPRPASGTP